MVVGSEFSDDAAVVRLDGDEQRALVLTADVIAPLVDDPVSFGEIAAVNAVSDVYAMGGRPLFALALAFFPDDDLPLDILKAILQGGAQACRKMGVAVVGGHTVRDKEIKYGLAVTGQISLDQILSNRTARPGQQLVLTKALGTGVIGTAIKRGDASEEELEASIASMTTSNGPAVATARNYGVTACTDVTGFGFFGHLRNLLLGSHLAARVELAALPLLPGAYAHAAAGRVPGGSKSNLAFLQPSLRGVASQDEPRLLLAADAQTSGGLLLTTPADQATALVVELQAQGLPAAVVGELVAPTPEAPASTIVLSC